MKRRYWWKVAEENDLPWKRIGDFYALPLPRPVVLVNGCFDLLTSGHLRLFCTARRLAGADGTVVCAMDGDEKVRQAKGAGRPILSWPERAAAMEFMPVDYLVEFESDEELVQLARVIQPDLRVQGAEYKGRTTKLPWVKKIFVPQFGGVSTTEIIGRIRK